MFHFTIGLLALMVMKMALSEPSTSASVGNGITLFVMGDWGGIPNPPYTMPVQAYIAETMGYMADIIHPQAVITLGDNFYFNGIETDEYSERFDQTWKFIYRAPSLNIPWYLIAGNHDYYGNITAQIEYSKHFTPDTGRSWNFPSTFYTKRFSGISGNSANDGGSSETNTAIITVDFVFIDTPMLTEELIVFQTVVDPTNPKGYTVIPFPAHEAAVRQYGWIEAQLAASTADYLFVAGHYPIYSVCEHGNTQNLVDNLKPLLLKYNVTGYLAGHDHCMSVVKEPEIPMYYIVSGSSNWCCTRPVHAKDIPADQTLEWYAAAGDIRGGFTTIQVPDLATGLTIEFYDQEGRLLHATDSIPPRAVASPVTTTTACTDDNCSEGD